MLSYYITGYQICAVPMTYAAAFLELCRSQGFVYDRFTTLDDGRVTLRMRSSVAKRAKKDCKTEGIPLEVIRERGLPCLWRRLWVRPGLCLGALAVIFMLWISSRFVWDVRIEGNVFLSERQVEATLRECGFGVGSYLGTFKADRVENKALIANKSLAWISVNMKGTVAYVQVREASYAPEKNDDTPANLIADTGGQIVRVELVRGNILVAAGQWVGKGDLLVSGLYDSEHVGFRYTHAEGKVYARTVENIQVEIPLTYEKKVYQTDKNAVFCEKSLIFFENHIKFSKKTGNIGEGCDIIKRVSVPFSKWGIDFPIAVVTEWYLPYEIVEEKRSYSEAEALAYLALARKIGELPGEVEVLSKTITTTHGEDVYILHCTLECIRDIAKEQSFSVEP